MTREQIMKCAAGLPPRDFSRFAARVGVYDETLGELVRLHAEAADGNSPDLVPAWVDGAARDAEALAAAGIGYTPEIAAAWWHWRYADGPEPVISAAGSVR